MKCDVFFVPSQCQTCKLLGVTLLVGQIKFIHFYFMVQNEIFLGKVFSGIFTCQPNKDQDGDFKFTCSPQNILGKNHSPWIVRTVFLQKRFFCPSFWLGEIQTTINNVEQLNTSPNKYVWDSLTSSCPVISDDVWSCWLVDEKTVEFQFRKEWVTVGGMRSGQNENYIGVSVVKGWMVLTYSIFKNEV